MEAERARIIELEIEISSIQSTCGMLKQQQRETTHLSEKAKREDLKQRNKLRLEIKKTKEHVESLRAISAAHEQRYAAALKNHDDTFQVALQRACDSEYFRSSIPNDVRKLTLGALEVARTEVHVESQAAYAAEFKRFEDELSDGENHPKKRPTIERLMTDCDELLAKTCLKSSGEEARKQTEECIRLHGELEDVRKKLWVFLSRPVRTKLSSYPTHTDLKTRKKQHVGKSYTERRTPSA